MLDRIAAWTYARFSRRLVPMFMAVGLCNAFLMAVMAMPGAAGLYDFRPVEFVTMVCLVTGLSAPGLVATAAIMRRDMRRLSVWSRERSAADAQDVWAVAVRFPRRAVIAGVLAFSVAYIPVSIYFWRITAIPQRELPLVLAYVEFLIIVPATMDYFVAERLLSPLVSDLASFLPEDFDPGFRGSALRWRLLFGFGVVATFTGATAATIAIGFARLSDDPAVLGSLALTVSLFVTVVIGYLPASYFAQSVDRPIHRLAIAAESVNAGDLSSRVPVISADEVGWLMARFNRMLSGLQQRMRLESAVSSYIDPVIAQRVAVEGAHIGGEAAIVTVMFVDIVGFTRSAEGVSPDDVVANLNDFFDVVIPVIETHGGHANKLLGDGVMAVFGVPQPLALHADDAFSAAKEIRDKLAAKYGDQLNVGIGLNSGTVVVGSMGGGNKLDYTIIGDAVNVAARVEAYTRTTGDTILLTDATKALLRHPDGLETRGSHEMRGRTQHVGLWSA
jgi:adenylate cyclase